jgi:hypothetical protein
MRAQPLVLDGLTVVFAPRYYPDTFRVRKERNLDRSKNFCSGEDVSDKGSKNREIHIAGVITSDEKDTFDRMCDVSEYFELTSATWSGEVRVEMGEYEGPTGYHSITDSSLFQYTLDLVSTGTDEDFEDGIIDEGEDIDFFGGPGVGVRIPEEEEDDEETDLSSDDAPDEYEPDQDNVTGGSII